MFSKMKFKSFYRRISLPLVAAFISLSLSLNAYAYLDGSWIAHSSATLRSSYKESQIDRIIDGARYVYFSVRGDIFYPELKYIYPTELGLDAIQIFRYDKSLPFKPENIRALAQDCELSGALPVVLEYSPRSGVMAVVYENKAIDFIYDDGTIVSSPALSELAVPSAGFVPYSVTIDDERSHAYVGCSLGYAVVDIKTGELADFRMFDRAVSWAGRVGDHIVVFAGKMDRKSYASDAFVFRGDAVPAELTNPVEGTSGLQALMPLSSDSFAALAPEGSDTRFSLKLFSITDDGVISQELSPAADFDDGAGYRYRHFFSSGGYVTPTADGYLINTVSDLIQLSKNGDKTGEVSKISKSTLPDYERKSKSASFDGKNIWFFTYNSNGLDGSVRGFYTRTLSDGQWSEASMPVAPQAPTAYIAPFGSWSPDYGVILRCAGAFFDTGAMGEDRFFSYKDGVWTDRSYAATAPSLINVTKAAKHVGVDPVAPNFVWGVSVLEGGLFRMDLENPANYFAFGTLYRPSWETAYPGYFPMFPQQKDYAQLISFSNVDFDSDGTMWFSRYIFCELNDFDYEDIQKGYVPLYYMTAEERKAISGASTDKALVQKVIDREIRVPLCYTSNLGRIIALKHPSNKNIIVCSHAYYYTENRLSFIINHNGTPDDTSDDMVVYLDELYDDEGERFSAREEFGAFEDPATGEVWLLTSSGPLVFDPADLFAGKKTGYRPRLSGFEGGIDFNFDHVSVNGMTVDPLGRKWLATEEGVYCVSADNRELLGWYNVSNSPLPSNTVYNVVCDESTGALIISTYRGIVEFRPEGSSVNGNESSRLSIWPSAVTPDYKGYVNISGVLSGNEYEVKGTDGTSVRTLGFPDNNVLQWDLRDNEGAKVAPGRYSVNRVGIDETNVIIVLD